MILILELHIENDEMIEQSTCTSIFGAVTNSLLIILSESLLFVGISTSNKLLHL